MKISTDLLYRLIRANGLGLATPDEVEAEIPPVLLPTLSVPGPLVNIAGPVSADIRRESFAFSFGQGRAASAAAINNTVATFGRGLWHVLFNFLHHSDFTSTPSSAATGALLRLVDPDATAVAIARLQNIATVSQTISFMIRLLFPQDSWILRLDQGATGVGQTLFSSLDGVALRLT